ncbi:KfrB domain-containing protein [Ralstonia pseudosolanacearum]|uniref:KfrB domain-containing protein n=1 Tax=Ralstonia pseudosolanacearum TaxID=1310165 RepID=UPI0033909B59
MENIEQMKARFAQQEAASEPGGLHIVAMEQYLADEPASLLAGAYTRDKEGAYRPAAGGSVVIQDLGDAVEVKAESPDAYQAAVELLKAKGWKPTEQDLARLAKAMAEARLREQAEHAETMQAVRESSDEITPAVAGHHIGPIVAVDGQFICQKTGRDPKQIIWHDTKKMDGHVPTIGQTAEIRYQDGRGHSINKALKQGVSR